MINKKELEEYIENIPPNPDIINKVIEEILKNDLKKQVK